MRPNNFTLQSGVIVSDAYARSRIIASLRPYGISLKERQAVADYIISGQAGLRGYLISALERKAIDIWISEQYKGV